MWLRHIHAIYHVTEWRDGTGKGAFEAANARQLFRRAGGSRTRSLAVVDEAKSRVSSNPATHASRQCFNRRFHQGARQFLTIARVIFRAEGTICARSIRRYKMSRPLESDALLLRRESYVKLTSKSLDKIQRQTYVYNYIHLVDSP